MKQNDCEPKLWEAFNHGRQPPVPRIELAAPDGESQNGRLTVRFWAVGDEEKENVEDDSEDFTSAPNGLRESTQRKGMAGIEIGPRPDAETW